MDLFKTPVSVSVDLQNPVNHLPSAIVSVQTSNERQSCQEKETTEQLSKLQKEIEEITENRDNLSKQVHCPNGFVFSVVFLKIFIWSWVQFNPKCLNCVVFR